VSTVQSVEVISSLAHRQGDQIRLVLHLPEAATPAAASVEVRLRAGKRRVIEPATVRAAAPGVVLEATIPAGRLARGIWSLAFRPAPDAPFEPIEARLLTGARQPISLIPGPVPKTRLPEPSPAVRAPARSLGRRVLSRASRVVREVRRRARR
jgi:hypothetical protein